MSEKAGGGGVSHRKQRHRWKRRLLRCDRTWARFGLYCKSSGVPAPSVALLQPGSPSLFLTRASTLSLRPFALLSLLPEILPPSSHDLLLAFIQNTTKVTSPKRPHQTCPSTPPRHQNKSLLPSPSIPWPGFILLQGPSPSRTSCVCSLPPRLDPELHEGKTWSVNHSCVLGAQHRAWLMMGRAQWPDARRMFI